MMKNNRHYAISGRVYDCKVVCDKLTDEDVDQGLVKIEAFVAPVLQRNSGGLDMKTLVEAITHHKRNLTVENYGDIKLGPLHCPCCV